MELSLQELERKYLSALADLVADHEAGNITLEAMMTGFKAVYDTVSGIVNWPDLEEIMAEYNQYTREGSIAA